MKELELKTPCAVSQECVTAVANIYPEVFKDKKGKVKVYSVLYALGFDLNPAFKHKCIYTNPNVRIRSNEKPDMTYVTTVYNGTVRYEVSHINKEGYVIYDKTRLHWLAKTYERFEVLQPPELNKYVSEDKLTNILEIGEAEAYNNGFQKMDTPPSEASQRNIVR